jgi:small-conductance mechanosensitive channel
MQQFFIAIILVLGLSSWYLFNENQTLVANNVKLESAVEEQKQTIQAIKDNLEKQGKALQNLQRKNAQIEADKDKYLSILSKHNFEKLAVAKPGLMELRFNKGTDEVLRELENDTKEISNLDSTNNND